MSIKRYTKKVEKLIEEAKVELSYLVFVDGAEELRPLLNNYQEAHLERCLFIEKLLAAEIKKYSSKTLS